VALANSGAATAPAVAGTHLLAGEGRLPAVAGTHLLAGEGRRLHEAPQDVRLGRRAGVSYGVPVASASRAERH
jgi:hypothetical protein